MRKVDIYYFSATGNSYVVAKDLARQLRAELFSVVPLMNQDHIPPAEVMGLVFPIYDFQAPNLINEFIKNIDHLENTYIFAVCTYGVMPLQTMKKLQKTIFSCGGTLSGAFTVKMPHNGLGFKHIAEEKQQAMFQKWEEKCPLIVRYVEHRNQGLIETSSRFQLLILLGMFIRMFPQLFRMLLQALLHGWDSLGFVVDERCTGCRVCENICPVDNISMSEGKPVWSDHCINCFGCLHWCPEEAINAAQLTKNMKRYHHPDVKRREIINQKKG